MRDKTSDGRTDVGFPPFLLPFGIETLMEINRPAWTAMAQVNGKVYENLAAMNKSWAEFLNRRLKKELGVPEKLAACKSLQEMYGVYAEHLQGALTDYQTELKEMSELGKTLADDTLQAMQTRAEQAVSNGRAN
jgi:hypothetical protein